MQDISIRISNYKCFDFPTGFDSVGRLNLIIGRNNTGKSSLLDMIQAVCEGTYKFHPSTHRSEASPAVQFKSVLDEKIITSVFSQSHSGGSIPGNHFAYGMQLSGKEIQWKKYGIGTSVRTELISCDDSGMNPPLNGAANYAIGLCEKLPIWLEGKFFKKIAAERDIVPEHDSEGSLLVTPNGQGATRLIQQFINKSNLPREKVRINLLHALNKVFAPDCVFTDIVCQQDGMGPWEIYLEEKDKGIVALSRSGSGLKTVILALVFLCLVPIVEKRELGDYVLAFEEPENNLHPALLRRLITYTYDAAAENGMTIFITTHSNVLIDLFNKREDTKIFHVTNRNGVVDCGEVRTYIDNHGVLDDLDVRASDILQANGIIWVEGPSDRVYINRWVELWSDGDLKEGNHYQVLFYGGRLLAHLTASDPDTVGEAISILRANRNAAMLIDSDIKKATGRINSTKRRIVREFEEFGGLCWVTKGREIENYVPLEIFRAGLQAKKLPDVKPHESVFAAIGADGAMPQSFSKRKHLLAENLVGHMTLENMSKVLDLNSKMRALCEQIRSWNQ